MTSEPLWPPEPLHVAVDVIPFTVRDGHLLVLLWRRPYSPYEGSWALIGTFSRPDETLAETPQRALQDKAGISSPHLEQLATYDQPALGSAPGRDPRGRVVSVAFLALVPAALGADVGSRDVGVDASPVGAVRWFDVTALPTALAFDHERMLDDARARLRAKAGYSSLPFELAPPSFTLPELQEVFEALLGETIDPRNFRRDLHAAGVIEDTGERRAGGPGRPAKLYRRRPGAFAVDAGERRTATRLARSGRDDDAE